MRGINRQILFEDEEDCNRFIQTLYRYREISKFKLYAYCLMGNHVHLLLMEGKEPLETVMRRICGSFVFWYNKKYNRIGYLFQDRFKSEAIDDSAYFLTALRYIFRNPVKANITDKIEEYKWSNYNEFIQGNINADMEYIINFLNIADKGKSLKALIEYINSDEEDECLEISEKRSITDEKAIKVIKDICKVDHVIDLQKFDVEKRNTYIKTLKKNNLSIRQIERLTGISRGIIQKL
jgi:REP element-mobilizing transposase RayT